MSESDGRARSLWQVWTEWYLPARQARGKTHPRDSIVFRVIKLRHVENRSRLLCVCECVEFVEGELCLEAIEGRVRALQTVVRANVILIMTVHVHSFRCASGWEVGAFRANCILPCHFVSKIFSFYKCLKCVAASELYELVIAAKCVVKIIAQVKSCCVFRSPQG